VGMTGEADEEADADADVEASALAEADAVAGVAGLASFFGLLAFAAAAAASRVPNSSVKTVSREFFISVEFAHLYSASCPLQKVCEYW